MKGTNEIQKQINKKAKDELHGLIDEFTDKLGKYEHETYSVAQFPKHSDMSGVSELNFGSSNPTLLIGRALQRMVDAAYLGKLTKKKTADLLTKLELL